MVAFAHSPCFQGSQVRTRAWLGITLTPPVFAAQNPGQVLLLLFFGAELDDDRSHHIYAEGDRKSTRLNSSHVRISYAVFCLKKKNKKPTTSPMPIASISLFPLTF